MDCSGASTVEMDKSTFPHRAALSDKDCLPGNFSGHTVKNDKAEPYTPAKQKISFSNIYEFI